MRFWIELASGGNSQSARCRFRRRPNLRLAAIRERVPRMSAPQLIKAALTARRTLLKSTTLLSGVALKFEPVMVTAEPALPDVGVIELMTGGDWATTLAGSATMRAVQSEAARSGMPSGRQRAWRMQAGRERAQKALGKKRGC